MKHNNRPPPRRKPARGRAWMVIFIFSCAVTAAAQAPWSFVFSESAAAEAPDEQSNTAIALADVATEAETAVAHVRDLRSDLASENTAAAVVKALPQLMREIAARAGETRKIIAQRPPLEILEALEGDWRRVRRSLAALTRQVTTRLAHIEREIAELENLTQLWSRTLAAAQTSGAPMEILQRIEAVRSDIDGAREEAQRERARALALQNRLAVQDARIADGLDAITQARDDVLASLFIRDGAPVWRQDTAQKGAVILESRGSLTHQAGAFNRYADRQVLRLIAHFVLFIGLMAGFYAARNKHRRLAAQDSLSLQESPIIERPIAAAALLSSLFIPWLYPATPRFFWAILGLLALVPSIALLRCRMRPVFYPILYALLAFYVIDRVRSLTAAVPVLPRALFLATLLGAVGFSLWTYRRLPAAGSRYHGKTNLALAVCLVLAAAAFIANAIGYVTLGNVLGNALLGSVYVGLVLAALIEVVDALIALLLNLRPLCLLSSVCRQRALVRRWIRRGLWWLAVAAWGAFVLRKLLLWERFLAAGQSLLTVEFSLGSLHFSFGDLIAFGLAVWAAFIVSRFVRFLLNEEIYPRVRLAEGLPYAISTMLHYLILFFGFLAALAALGIDMTRVTILAGAFSVGVGFGLQAIFNNFISGIILLFERPVKVGDLVQIEDATGTVEHIGIRASIIRTSLGSEIIVPNGKLISDRVVNWTLSNRRHSIALPVSIAPSADPQKALALLERTAAGHPLIARDPPPQALVLKLGPDSVALELRAWTDRVEQWMEIRSELAIAVSGALAAENIGLR